MPSLDGATVNICPRNTRFATKVQTKNAGRLATPVTQAIWGAFEVTPLPDRTGRGLCFPSGITNGTTVNLRVFSRGWTSEAVEEMDPKSGWCP